MSLRNPLIRIETDMESDIGRLSLWTSAMFDGIADIDESIIKSRLSEDEKWAVRNFKIMYSALYPFVRRIDNWSTMVRISNSYPHIKVKVSNYTDHAKKDTTITIAELVEQQQSVEIVGFVHNNQMYKEVEDLEDALEEDRPFIFKNAVVLNYGNGEIIKSGQVVE